MSAIGRNTAWDQEGKVSVKVISTDETERSHPEARAEGGGRRRKEVYQSQKPAE